jgi:hypothetical protein
MSSARLLSVGALLALGCIAPKHGVQKEAGATVGQTDDGGSTGGPGAGRGPTSVSGSDAAGDQSAAETAAMVPDAAPAGSDTRPVTPDATATPDERLALPPDAAPDLASPPPDLASDLRAVVDAMPVPTANRAFVTAATYSSNLGGLAGADAKCQQSAEAAGMIGTFRALLSTSKVGAFTRLGSSRGWVRSDGTAFGDTQADLLAGKIYYPLSLDEYGRPFTEGYYALTGTKNDGTPDVGRTSNDWGTPGAGCRVTVGMASSGGARWYSANDQSCDYPYHLFCLEVGRNMAVPRPVPPPGARVAFLSKTVWNPSTGLPSADTLCATEAQGAGLAGAYRAFLATSTASAVSRFDLAGAPWVRTDGVLVATGADLTKGSALAPLLLGADGQVSGVVGAWTGSEAPDKLGTENCRDWSSNDVMYYAWFGAPSLSDTDSFGNGRRRCDVNISGIYCFQR